MRDAFACAVVGVHHAGKNGDMRGSTVLRGAGDFVFRLTRKDRTAPVLLECEKQKDGPDGWSDAYAPVLVDLGEGKRSLVLDRTDACAGQVNDTTPENNCADASNAEKRAVVSAVLQAMGGGSEARLGEIRPVVTRLLNEAGITRSQSGHVINGKVTTWLAGDGSSTVTAAGQAVRIRARKEGVGDKAPWVISVRAEEAEEVDASVASDARSGVLA